MTAKSAKILVVDDEPQILRFLLTAAKVRAQYDPVKLTTISIRRDGHAQA